MRPVIGDDVIIGSGAEVLGGIIIGNNVTIGANAVVTQSVPDNVVVGGIPARVLREKPTLLRQ
jgi:serine O-acetyltransferase